MTNCLNCQSSNSKEWISFNDIFETTHHLSKCDDCGIYFLNPQPNKKQLAQAYNEDYYGQGEKKFNSTVERVVDWFRQRSAKAFASQLPEKAKVLDIGCGNGSFLANVGLYGDFELHGIEPEGKSADRALKHSSIKLHKGFLEKGTYESGSFDAIVLTHVFEHLPNPREILDIINQLSKPSTVLQIEIPNIESWQAKFFKGDWLHLDPPRHLNMYPPNILVKELIERGWELKSEKYFSPQFSPFGLQQSLLNRVNNKRELLYEHLKGNDEYVKGISPSLLFIQKMFHWVSFPLFVMTDTFASSFKKGATVKLLFTKK